MSFPHHVKCTLHDARGPSWHIRGVSSCNASLHTHSSDWRIDKYCFKIHGHRAPSKRFTAPRACSGKSGAKKGKKKGSVKPVPRERNSKGSHVGGETGAAPFLAQPATNGHALAQPARAAVNGSPAAVNGQQAASESGTARSGATAQPRLPAGDSVGSGSGSLDQDSDYAAESLARQLQSDWPVRTACPTPLVRRIKRCSSLPVAVGRSACASL